MFKPRGVKVLTIVIMLMAFSCSGPEPDQPLLTAELPLHLEDHIEDANLVDSKVPKNLLAPVEWEHTLLIIASDHGQPAGSFALFGGGMIDLLPTVLGSAATLPSTSHAIILRTRLSEYLPPAVV